MDCILATRAVAVYMRELLLPYLYGDSYELCGRILSFERPWGDLFNYNHSQSFIVGDRRLGFFCQCRMCIGNSFLCKFIVWDRKKEYLPRLISTAPERNILGSDFFVYLDEDLACLGKRVLERLSG